MFHATFPESLFLLEKIHQSLTTSKLPDNYTILYYLQTFPYLEMIKYKKCVETMK